MWTTVLGVSTVPTTTVQNTPDQGTTKNVYGAEGWFEAYTVAGGTHNIPQREAVSFDFFGLKCVGTGCFEWGQGGPKRAT